MTSFPTDFYSLAKEKQEKFIEEQIKEHLKVLEKIMLAKIENEITIKPNLVDKKGI